MHETWHHKWGKPMMVLHPGDFASSTDDMLLCTVLGSCIAVVLYDQHRHLGGMNHFMLPESRSQKNLLLEESGKYGMFAMELLINDMLKKGTRREHLVAKIFGGGHVLRTHGSATVIHSVPQNNILFAKEYLEAERIPLVSSDVGGANGRKIYLFTHTGRVLLKRISHEAVVEVVQEEDQYQRSLHKTKPAEGPVFF